MPSFCNYSNCHNLGSSTYQGYCNAEHLKKGPEHETLMDIISKIPGIGTIKEAREFLEKKRVESEKQKISLANQTTNS